MNIKIKFQEISNLLSRLANAEASIKYLDPKSIEVTHKAAEGSPVPSFVVTLKFEFIGENEFKLYYVCDESLAAMVTGLLAMVNLQGLGVNSAEKYIQINLNQLEMAAPFVANATFSDITFDQESLAIDIPVK